MLCLEGKRAQNLFEVNKTLSSSVNRRTSFVRFLNCQKPFWFKYGY